MDSVNSYNIAILLSGGKGSRMNSSTPKQYMDLCGKKILAYSLEVFERSPLIDAIVVVCAKEDTRFCEEEIIIPAKVGKVCALINGGKERYDSVFNGLCYIKDHMADHIRGKSVHVFIHDGARPMVTEEILERCLEAARTHGACAVGVQSKDTVKICDPDGKVIQTPDRRTVWCVQTPQTFRFELILDAYEKLMKSPRDGVTDDAMVAEQMLGIPVYMVTGSYKNIKITTPEDMITAAGFLSDK